MHKNNIFHWVEASDQWSNYIVEQFKKAKMFLSFSLET